MDIGSSPSNTADTLAAVTNATSGGPIRSRTVGLIDSRRTSVQKKISIFPSEVIRDSDEKVSLARARDLDSALVETGAGERDFRPPRP